MSKLEIESTDEALAWTQAPGPAIFQGLDLVALDQPLAEAMVTGCALIGCLVGPATIAAAARCGSLVVSAPADLPFRAFPGALYSPGDLYDALSSDGGLDYARCYDRRVYLSYADPDRRRPRLADLDVVVMRRLHDTAISDALEDLLTPEVRTRAVAVMGGHDVPRTAPRYRQVALLAGALAAAGYTVLTGGGPGLMEAANLGAYTAGFADPPGTLDTILAAIAAAPRYADSGWIESAFAVWRELGPPDDPERSRNVGVPTWFYGHEPPNLFATHIAKYFENSVREEGLLALAEGGVIFAEGNAGTVQEIFQDACQNYYATSGLRSPMVLLDSDYWDPRSPGGRERAKPAWPLLRDLASERGFEDQLLLTDDPGAVVDFIATHPPRADGA